MEEFRENDDGYKHWVRENRDGFVVNCERLLNPNNLVLHRATCRTITELTQGVTWTEGEYIKVCADKRWELQQWAREKVGGRLKECTHCDP